MKINNITFSNLSILAFLIIASFENCTTTKQNTSVLKKPNTEGVQPKPASQSNTSTEKKIEYERWQQRAEYTMNVDFDDTKHQYSGTQKLVYYNNSTDELDKAFYHLYMNAFQPGSSMDVRSRFWLYPLSIWRF